MPPTFMFLGTYVIIVGYELIVRISLIPMFKVSNSTAKSFRLQISGDCTFEGPKCIRRRRPNWSNKLEHAYRENSE